VVAGEENRTDDELAAAASTGDREAFASLYERYFSDAYDLAFRTLRDSASASDVAQVSFVNAWESLRKGKQPERFRPWFFKIAHHATIDELRRRRRLVEPPTEGEDQYLATLAAADLRPESRNDPEAVAEQNELVQLVWTAAAALDRQQYALLDLHLRKGLSAEELASHYGLSRQNIYTRLSRAKDSLERAVGVSFLVRRGRRDCQRLNALLAATGEEVLTLKTERLIARHVRDCPTCQGNYRRFTAAAEIFAGLAPVPVILGLKENVWGGVTAGLDGKVRIQGVEGKMPVHTSVVSSVGLAAGALVVTLAGVLIGVLIVVDAFGDEDEPASANLVPRDPDGVRSASHQLASASDQNVVQIVWLPLPEAAGYSVLWSNQPIDLPDQTVDLPGTATETVSPPLAPGSWAFHLRTQWSDGRWTSTVHLCCFVIEAPDPGPIAGTSPRRESEQPEQAQPSPTAPPRTQPTLPAPTAPPTMPPAPTQTSIPAPLSPTVISTLTATPIPTRDSRDDDDDSEPRPTPRPRPDISIGHVEEGLIGPAHPSASTLVPAAIGLILALARLLRTRRRP
jgi:RNA polymerase sigma factor (sigma-70 family)